MSTAIIILFQLLPLFVKSSNSFGNVKELEADLQRRREYFAMSNNNNNNSARAFNSEDFKDQQCQMRDSAAACWLAWWPTFERGAQKVSDKLIELAEIKSADKVLDIATGIGEPAVTAARKVMPNGKAIVIDISPQMLEIAKTRAKSLGLDAIMEFRESDGEKLDLLEPRARFNAILSRWGLMLLPNLDSALGRIRQILVTTAVTLLLHGLLLPRFHCLIWLSQQ